MTTLNTCELCGKYEWACRASGGCMIIKTRVDYLEAFKKVTEEMYQLTYTKNNDYGGATDPWKNFRDFGELGILVRMSDKFARIKSALAEKRALKVMDETVEDTIKDLAIYSIILLLWRRSQVKENEDK